MNNSHCSTCNVQSRSKLLAALRTQKINVIICRATNHSVTLLTICFCEVRLRIVFLFKQSILLAKRSEDNSINFFQ